MRGFLKLVILVPVAILAVVLSLANRAPVTLSLDPFRPDAPALSISVPLFVVIFVTLILGLLVGGAGAWLGQGKWRRAARRRRQELEELQRENLRHLPDLPASALPAKR
jgi:hypothetical protein